MREAHYKNDRFVEVGDKILTPEGVGIVRSFKAGKGKIDPVAPKQTLVKLRDCLHLDDINDMEIRDSTKPTAD